MNKTIDQVVAEADKKIPREEVSTRDSGYGRTFSYLTAHYVIARMNQVFGTAGWDSETIEMRQVKGDSDKPTAYVAKVRVSAIVKSEDGGYMKVVKEGYGFGADKTKRDGTCNNPHEDAVKEAESDAFKRAARQFGMSLGLALYSKDQENVEDAPKVIINDKSFATGTVVHAPKPELPKAAPETPIRESLNKKITAMSKVVIAKRLKTLDELKSDMKSKYSVDSATALSDTQAKELFTTLEAMANGP